MEERLTNLETQISFQDQTIEDLNQRIIEQQQQIDLLTKQLKKLTEKVSSQDEPGIVDISLEVPPPHY